MTKDEFLKKAGYIPVMGRPKIFKEPAERYVLLVPKELKKALDKMGTKKVREILGKCAKC